MEEVTIYYRHWQNGAVPPLKVKGPFFPSTEWGGNRVRGKIKFPPHQLHKIIAFTVVSPLKDRVFLQQKYVVEGLSIAEIAALTFSSTSAVHKHLREFGITTRAAATKNKTRLAYGEAWSDRSVVPHQRELQNIEKMRELRAKGFSYWKIAEIFNSMSIPTKTRRGKWHARSIQQILDAADGK